MNWFKKILMQKYDLVIGIIMAIDEQTFKMLQMAEKKQLAKFTVYGPETIIKPLMEKYHIKFVKIINCSNEMSCLSKVAQDLKTNAIDLVMKGLISTGKIMKMILNPEHDFINKGALLSHLAVIKVTTYPKILFLSDAAINIKHELNDLVQIINNALKLMTTLAYKNPKIAILSALEQVNSKIVSSQLAYEIANLPVKTWVSSCQIAGPLSLDLAISNQSFKIKNFDCKVQGDADLLICPNLESANILYKSLVYFSKAQAMGIVLGAKFPIILTSRSDSFKTKLLSVALALWFLKYQNESRK